MLLIVKGETIYVISCDDLLFFPYETMEMVLQNERFNAVGVVLLIAQGCQAIVQATLG